VPLKPHRTILKAALLQDLRFVQGLYLSLVIEFHIEKKIKEEKKKQIREE
jgi:hypothetical protein